MIFFKKTFKITITLGTLLDQLTNDAGNKASERLLCWILVIAIEIYASSGGRGTSNLKMFNNGSPGAQSAARFRRKVWHAYASIVFPLPAGKRFN